MRFSHIIATKGRPGPLADALASSVALKPGADEVIVVDGDPDRSAEAVVARFGEGDGAPSLRYLASAPGLTRQRNVGLDAARGEVVLFTDDDCTLAPDLLAVLEEAYRDATVIAVTGYIHTAGEPDLRIGSDPHSRLRWLALGGGRQGTMTPFGFRRPIVDVNTARDVEFMPGPLMSARTQVAREVRFDERLPGYALGEDDDFSFRLSRRGRIRYLPRAVVTHHELGFRGTDAGVRDRRLVVNRSYLFRKNFSGSLRARLGFAALMVMLLVHRAINREWEGLRGLLEGLRAVRRGEQPA